MDSDVSQEVLVMIARVYSSTLYSREVVSITLHKFADPLSTQIMNTQLLLSQRILVRTCQYSLYMEAYTTLITKE